MIAFPAFSDGWSGRVCFSDLTCPPWGTDCALTGQWYALWATVVGGEHDSTFNVCFTSVKAVTNN